MSVAQHLAAALEWRYGAVADTAGERIIAWRHATEPQPTDLAALVADYLAAESPRQQAIAAAEATAAAFAARLDAAGLSERAALYAVVRDLIAALPANRQTTATTKWANAYDNAAAAAGFRT